jgi:hypothetical protein
MATSMAANSQPGSQTCFMANNIKLADMPDMLAIATSNQTMKLFVFVFVFVLITS